MTDEPFMTPLLKTSPRQTGTREKLLEFLRGHDRCLCELRDNGQWGFEIQFSRNEECRYSRRFDTIPWAAWERDAIQKDGAQ